MSLKTVFIVTIVFVFIASIIFYIKGVPHVGSVGNLDTTVTLEKIAENPDAYIGKKVEILGMLQKTWSFPEGFNLPDEFKYQYEIYPICSNEKKLEKFIMFAFSKENYNNFTGFLTGPEIITGKILPFQEKINKKLEKYTDEKVLMLEIEDVKNISEPMRNEFIIKSSSISTEKIKLPEFYEYMRISPSGNIIATAIMIYNTTKKKEGCWGMDCYDHFVLQIYPDEKKWELVKPPYLGFTPYYVTYVSDDGWLEFGSYYGFIIIDSDGSKVVELDPYQDIIYTDIIKSTNYTCLRLYSFNNHKLFFKLGKGSMDYCDIKKNPPYYSIDVITKEIKRESKAPDKFKRSYSREFKKCRNLYTYDVREDERFVRFDSSDGRYTIFIEGYDKSNNTVWKSINEMDYIKIIKYDNTPLLKYID